MIQTTLHTHLECKETALCMEPSIRQDYSTFTITMSPVLCAMLQQGWQSPWSQLKLGVHQHRLWSTLATSCQPTEEFQVTLTIVPCLSVLTRTQTLFLEVLQMLMVHCSIIQKPAAQECHVHLMIPRKNLHVQFVPNSIEQFAALYLYITYSTNSFVSVLVVKMFWLYHFLFGALTILYIPTTHIMMHLLLTKCM